MKIGNESFDVEKGENKIKNSGGKETNKIRAFIADVWTKWKSIPLLRVFHPIFIVLLIFVWVDIWSPPELQVRPTRWLKMGSLAPFKL